MALLDAAALASALETYSDIDQALRHYAKLRRVHVYLYQMMSLGLTPVFQSHARHPAVAARQPCSRR